MNIPAENHYQVLNSGDDAWCEVLNSGDNKPLTTY